MELTCVLDNEFSHSRRNISFPLPLHWNRNVSKYSKKKGNSIIPRHQ